MNEDDIQGVFSVMAVTYKKSVPFKVRLACICAAAALQTFRLFHSFLPFHGLAKTKSWCQQGPLQITSLEEILPRMA